MISDYDDFVMDEDEIFESDSEDDDKWERVYDGRFWEPEPDGSVTLRQWDMFIDKASFLDVVRDYMVQEGIYMRYLKNEPTRYTGKCEGKSCDWRIHASLMPDGVTFQVKTIKGKHSCKRLLDNPAATYSWIARKLFDIVRAEPNISVKGISKILMTKYNLHKNANTIWRAKVKILGLVKGKHEEGFTLLAKYTEMIKASNPGSTCFIKWNEPICEGIRPVFCRMFMCFNACKEGFLSGCRRFIGVDGTHLKGVYKGVLLTAMGIDAQNHCFPLAYSIVAVENKENWAYFFSSLRAIIRDDLAGQYTFISDRCKVFL